MRHFSKDKQGWSMDGLKDRIQSIKKKTQKQQDHIKSNTFIGNDSEIRKVETHEGTDQMWDPLANVRGLKLASIHAEGLDSIDE